MQELSEVFWSFLISSCVGLLLACCRFAYRSKCKEVNFCCIKIVRDVEGEERIDEREPPSPRAENTNSQRV
jgi:hypothetical protein